MYLPAAVIFPHDKPSSLTVRSHLEWRRRERLLRVRSKENGCLPIRGPPLERLPVLECGPSLIRICRSIEGNSVGVNPRYLPCLHQGIGADCQDSIPSSAEAQQRPRSISSHR